MFAIRNRDVWTGWVQKTLLRRAIVAALVTVSLVSPAAAQRFRAIPPKLKIREARELGGQVSTALRNTAAFSSGGQQKIDSYFKTFYFPMMTQTGATDLARLGKLREDLFKRYLRAATVPAAQTYLTSVTLETMSKIARNSFHPAVRYNATLILGMLDQQYAGRGQGATPPKVLSEATNELLELLEQNEFKDVKVHPSVKVGALEGLERHVRFGLDGQYTDRVTKAAMAVLAQEPTTLDVDADVNNWIKCQAARVLVRQFEAGPNAEVHTALTKLIADSEMTLEDRCCIVGLLDMMTYTAGTGADASTTVVPLGKLTQAVVADGAEKARAYEDLILGDNPGGRRGGLGGGRNAAQGPKLERRQLLARLTMIEKGAKSLSQGLPDEEKQKVQSLTELLTPVMNASKSKRSLDLDVAGDVIKLEDTIDNIVASWQPAAVGEAEDADFTEEN